MKKRLANYKIVEHLTTVFTARVKFKEADSLGIVWHGNYIEYFEEGREAFGREHGMSYLDIFENKFTTPIVNVVSDYKFPLRYGDVYTIKTHILNHPAAKILHFYEIFNQDGILVCEGQTTQAFVDLEGNLSLYSPDFYEEWKKKVNFK